MLLYFKDECLGKIQDIQVEGTWVYGQYIPNENMIKYDAFFKALVDEEVEFDERAYDTEWVQDKNWFIVDESNNKRGIYLPAVYEDGEINWRWR
jgi:hypothetical protein